jgi:site-specific DNA recombinase
MAKKAVIYARVSSKGQSDNYSLPTQKAAMREYAKRHGFEVIDELEDTHTGNSPVAERAGGAAIYSHLKQKSVDAIILYTIDRAARDDEAIEYAIFKRDVKRAGAELHFVDTGKTADDLFGGMMEQFKAMGASDERQKIRERMIRGRKAKAASGKWVCGNVPYGYEKVGLKKDAHLIVHKERAAIVQRMFDMYIGTNGKKKFALNGIATVLNQEGVPTPRNGVAWCNRGVGNIIKNSAYIGEFRYQDQVIRFPDLAIISKETFEAAQKQKEKNKELSPRNLKNEYLLVGHIFCGCGGRMFAHTLKPAKYNGMKKPLPYYRCGWQTTKRHTCEFEVRYLNAKALEGAVWDFLVSELDEQKLIEGLRASAKKKEAELEPKRARLATLDELIKKAERKIKKLINAFADSDDDSEDETVAAEMKSAMKAAVQHKDSLMAEKDRVVAELAKYGLSDDEQRAIAARVEKLKKKIATGKPTYQQKRDVINLLDVEVRSVKQNGKVVLSVSYVLRPDPVQIDIPCSIVSESKSHHKEIAFCAYLPLPDHHSLAARWLQSAGVAVVNG